VGEQWRVMKHAFNEGAHYPENLDQFRAVVEQCSRLHHNGGVHGDIRKENVVFGQQSSLLDFDYSGKEDEQTYPDHF